MNSVKNVHVISWNTRNALALFYPQQFHLHIKETYAIIRNMQEVHECKRSYVVQGI